MGLGLGLARILILIFVFIWDTIYELAIGAVVVGGGALWRIARGFARADNKARAVRARTSSVKVRCIGTYRILSQTSGPEHHIRPGGTSEKVPPGMMCKNMCTSDPGELLRKTKKFPRVQRARKCAISDPGELFKKFPRV